MTGAGVRPGPELDVLDTAEALATDVADDAVRVLTDAVAEHGLAHLVVTGGSILEAVLSELSSRDVPWADVHVWWGDERYVASDSDDRNDLVAIAKLFGGTDAVLHRMPASDAGFDTAEAAADSYAADLAGFGALTEPVPRFDVVLLGVGPDGHCASLFPGHPGTRVVGKSVIAVHESPKPPPDRISLTFQSLDAARRVWVIVSGSGKAEAVARALDPATNPIDVPSAGPRGRDETRWRVDRDAAADVVRPTPSE